MSAPELMKESQYTLRAQGNYDDIYSHVIAHIADKNGKLKKDQKIDGIIEASWRYGVNPFGLRLGISINKNQDETYTISVNGFFVDAIDTFGSARKKARNFVDQLINPIETKVYTPPIPSQGGIALC